MSVNRAFVRQARFPGNNANVLRQEDWEAFAEEFVRLSGLPASSLELIPIYARPGAAAAMRRVQELYRATLLRPGVYYIVLVDLCGSTEALQTLGQTLGVARIQAFILATVQALQETALESVALPLKEAGDAMLFIFASFSDVTAWWHRLQSELDEMTSEYLHEHGDSLTAEDCESFSMNARTVVHLGEVAFPSGGNPVALAVSETFKLEKAFAPGELGCSDAVKETAEPLFRGLKISAVERCEVDISETKSIRVWNLSSPPPD